MSGWLESTWLPAVGYIVVAAVALVVGAGERRRGDSDQWPALWTAVAVLAVVMAVARATELGELVSGFGRRKARSQGWYESRRALQAVVIVALGLIAVMIPFLVVRIAGRHRRHLPALISLCALGGLAAVRVVSLHQVDKRLARTVIGDVSIGTVLELSLQAIAVVVMWRSGREPRSQVAGSDGGVARDREAIDRQTLPQHE